MINSQHLTELIISTVAEKDIRTVMQYGNINGKDIDIFIILSRDILYEKITKNYVDITVVGYRFYGYLLSVFDPIATEPTLNGTVLWGENISKEKTTLLNSKSNLNTINHLINFSLQIISQAKQDFQQKNVPQAFINIIFALSYAYYASYYVNCESVVEFKALLKNNRGSLLEKLYQYQKTNKLNQLNMKSQIYQAENEIHKMMLSISSQYGLNTDILLPPT